MIAQNRLKKRTKCLEVYSQSTKAADAQKKAAAAAPKPMATGQSLRPAATKAQGNIVGHLEMDDGDSENSVFFMLHDA